jgi:exosome complex component RRP4
MIYITPSKVPRVIGKNGSMVSMIKEQTKCQINVGQNGIVWIKGENVLDEAFVTKALLKIEHESHIEGLTDSIKNLLETSSRKEVAK